MQRKATRPLLQGRYRRPGCGVIVGKATLYSEHIDFFELRWRGPRWFSVSFEHIEKVRWWSANYSDVNLMLQVRGGQRLRFKMNAPGLWKHQVEEQWRQIALPDEPKPRSYTREEVISAPSPRA